MTPSVVKRSPPPLQGFGLGLRPEHYQDILIARDHIDWLEILSDNYMVPGGKPLQWLDQIAPHFPLAMHGVGLNIGSTDPIDLNYLVSLKQLIERLNPIVVSDHLCWTGCNGRYLHDLLPLPFTRAVVDHLVSRIAYVQDFLGVRIAFENLSAYMHTPREMEEWEFIAEVVTRADCLLLLDVNNLYISSCNLGFSPLLYLDGIPKDRISQIHIAGHSHNQGILVDTHDDDVSAKVWSLYASTVARFGPLPTMIERDDRIPPLQELLSEVAYGRQLQHTLR